MSMRLPLPLFVM